MNMHLLLTPIQALFVYVIGVFSAFIFDHFLQRYKFKKLLKELMPDISWKNPEDLTEAEFKEFLSHFVREKTK